jgi:hypothetical protein
MSVMTLVPQNAISRRASGSNPDEIKHVDVPVHHGIVRAQAQQVEEQWNPPIGHLKGKVSVRIYPDAKTRSAAVLVQADQVDIDQTTGQISPRGNVHLGVADASL